MQQQVDPAVTGSPSASVDVSSGNLLVHEIDSPVGPVQADGSDPAWAVDRWYNSSRAVQRRDVGAGWTTGLGYDVRLEFPDANTVNAILPSQFVVTFARASDGSYTPTDPAEAGDASLTSAGGGYVVSVASTGQDFAFDGSGQETSASDDSQTIRFEYTSAAGQTRLSAVDDADSHATRFSYDGTGSIIEADTPASEHGYYHYDGARASDVSSPAGGTTTYGYGPNGRLASLDRGDRHVAIVYDTSGRVVSLIDGSAHVGLAYGAPDAMQCADAPEEDPATSETTVTRADGATASYCFDANGHEVAMYAPDHEAPTLDLSGAAGEYGAAENQTLLAWDPADDPDLANGDASGGIAGYTVRYRINGGPWSDPATTTVPRLFVDGGAVGDHVDLDVSATDAAQNTSAVQTASFDVVAFDESDGDTLACAETSDGSDPDCVDDGTPENYEDAPATFEDLDSSSSPGPQAQAVRHGLREAKINVESGQGWTTARLRPGSFVTGNVHTGTTIDIVPPDALGYGFGTIHGSYGGCGWVFGKEVVGSANTNGSSGCDNTFVDHENDIYYRVPSLSTIAAGVNHLPRKEGKPIQLRSVYNGHEIHELYSCANLAPYVGLEKSRHNCVGPRQHITYESLARGYHVRWRYVTRNEQWVLAEDPHDVRYDADHNAERGYIYWWFIPRRNFGTLCKDSNGHPASGALCSPDPR